MALFYVCHSTILRILSVLQLVFVRRMPLRDNSVYFLSVSGFVYLFSMPELSLD